MYSMITTQGERGGGGGGGGGGRERESVCVRERERVLRERERDVVIHFSPAGSVDRTERPAPTWQSALWTPGSHS